MSIRGRVLIAVKVVATAGLLWFALGRIDWAVVGLRLNAIVPLFGVAALIVLGLQPLLSAIRWRLIAGYSGFSMSVPQAYRLSLIGAFFNQTLPSSLGGDGARIWLLVKGGTAPSAATYSVLLDRVMGVLWLIILAVACLPWSLAIISNPAGRISLIVCALGGSGRDRRVSVVRAARRGMDPAVVGNQTCRRRVPAGMAVVIGARCGFARSQCCP